jgi:alkylated DNA repair dioxygenase AlkB
MGVADNLSWTVPEENRPSTNWDIPPLSDFRHRAHNATSALAVGAETTIFVRFNPKDQLSIPHVKFEAGYEQSFQIKQFSDKLVNSHRFLLLSFC